MGIPIWTVPDEAVHFIYQEFNRFAVPEPYWQLVNTAADWVISYVARMNYFPVLSQETLYRYNQQPGLREDEKHALIGPIEFRTGGKYDIHTIELAAWAALLWCWSEEGERHVRWIYRTEIAPEVQKREVPRHQLEYIPVGQPGL